jgi:hypothetical protein
MLFMMEQKIHSPARQRTGRGALAFWLFKIDGTQMHGTLTIDEKTLYRIIEVTKAD